MSAILPQDNRSYLGAISSNHKRQITIRPCERTTRHHHRILLDSSRRRLALLLIRSINKGHNVRQVDLRPHLRRGCTRSSSKGWTQIAHYWLVLIACLAQLWMPAQHRHMPFAAHAIALNSGAASSGLAPYGLGAGKSAVHCSLLGDDSSPHNGGAPAPCQNDNCPCCPFVPAATGVLPQEAARAAYSPRLAATVAPAAVIGSPTRSAGIAGQPRAPPILI